MLFFRQHVLIAIAVCAYLKGNSVKADFMATVTDANGMPVIARLHDDGHIRKLYDFESTDPVTLTLGGLGLDGNVYLIASQYPAMGVIRLNPRTGEFLDTLSNPFTGSEKIAGLTGAHQLAFAPNGDLFLLGSGPDPGGSDYGLSQVHRIDSETGLSKSVYSIVEPYGYSDIVVRPASAGNYDAEVFITEGYGWLRRWFSSDIDQSEPGSPSANSPPDSSWIGQSFARTMEFGPDGDLYFRTDSSSIWRYDADAGSGSLLIESIPNPFQPNIISLGGNVTFGPDGDLFLLRHGTYGSLTDWHSVVYRFDGATGALLGTVMDGVAGDLGTIGELLYLPVPEPAAQAFFALGISLLIAARRSRH